MVGSGLGFLAATLATLVLSIRALVLHRQSRWAVSALIVIFPLVAAGAMGVAAFVS